MSVQPLKGGQLCIQDLIKNLDVDGDGDIDDEDLKIKGILLKMDQDGDGHISLRELVNIGKGKMEDERKMGNLKKIMYIGAAVAAIFIILSLSVTIAAIELTKESRNSDSTMIDATSGKPVSTAVLTGGIDPLTGKKDTGIKDSDGNLASVGLATASVRLDSRTLTLESAKMITSLTLPVLDNGVSKTMSVTVTGFEMGGSRVVFYTASGGMVVVKGESIVVYKKGIDGTIRSLPVDTYRPETRRSRSLLQTSGGGSDNNCGSGMACGSGPCQDASCQTPPCGDAYQDLQVWNDATSLCECIPGAEPLPDADELECQCSGITARTTYGMFVFGTISHACVPCPDNSHPSPDHTTCICSNDDEVFTASSSETDTVPAWAGYCAVCPEGMSPFDATTCQCTDPCDMEVPDSMMTSPSPMGGPPPCLPGFMVCGGLDWSVAFFAAPGNGLWYRSCMREDEDPTVNGGIWCQDFDIQNPPAVDMPPAYVPNPCGDLQVLNSDTDICECIPGAEPLPDTNELVCQCSGNTVSTPYPLEAALLGQFAFACAPCPGDTVPTADHTSCTGCENGYEFVMSLLSLSMPTVAGECVSLCPPGMIMFGDECECEDPCVQNVPEWLQEPGQPYCMDSESCGADMRIAWMPLPPGTWSRSCVPDDIDLSLMGGMWCEDFDLLSSPPPTSSAPTTAPTSPGGDGDDDDSQPAAPVPRPTTSRPGPDAPSRTTSAPGRSPTSNRPAAPRGY